jgi:aryl-alcohol dehydrogenase-like predicted oxidoreductase
MKSFAQSGGATLDFARLDVGDFRTMKHRRFGRLGWSVSEVGTGMWGMASWSGADETEVKQALQRAVDLGCNFFDTAWAYGAGHSERLLGDLVRANPGQRLYTATKIPPRNQQWPSRRQYSVDDCYPPDHIEEFVRRSLANAGLPAFDLIQFHTWEDAWLSDGRLFEKLADLRRQGLFQGVGISLNRWEPWNGVEAVRSGAVDAVQVVYNIFDQNPEDQLFPLCAARDVAVIARVPFDEGSLTGTLTVDTRWPEGDWRNIYFAGDRLAESVAHADALRSLLQPGLSMPDLALRFILSHPAVSTVIPGMRRPAHVEANLAASAAGPLPDRLVGELRRHRWDRMPPI